MKLTGWYQGDQKPVRAGWYERGNPYNPLVFYRHYWDSFWWKPTKYSSKIMQYQNLPWRGVAK